MRALQLHYTSCRFGASGSAGYQVRALSDGITQEERRSLEQRGLYIPPRDAPQRPTPEDIENEFPVAYRFHRLPSQRPALTRSCYVGQDHTLRWGNYFAHSLVLEDRVSGRWPMDFFDWEGWKRSLPDEEDRSKPPPLPAVDVASIEPSNLMSLPALAEFLQEDEGRVPMLATMVRAVLAGRTSSRPVLLVGDSFFTPLWIACVHRCFPAQVAWNLEFSSYQHESRGCLALNATTGQTDLVLDDRARRFQFYVFDLEAGSGSEVEPLGEEYARTVSTWLARDPERLSRFYAYCEDFSLAIPSTDLLHAVRFFQMAEGILEPLGPDLPLTLDFVRKHGTETGKRKAMEALGRSASTLGTGSWVERKRALDFLQDGARAWGGEGGQIRPEHLDLVLAVWLAGYDETIFKEKADLGPVMEARKEILEAFPGANVKLDLAFLQQDHLARLMRHGRQAGKDRRIQVLVDFWSAHARNRSKASTRDFGGLLAHFWRDADVGDLGRGLFAVEPSRDGILALSELIWGLGYERLSDEDKALRSFTLGEGLSGALEKASAKDAMHIRRHLWETCGVEVIEGEFMALLDRAQDRVKVYRRYVTEVIMPLDLALGAGKEPFPLMHVLGAVLQDTQRATVELAVDIVRGNEVKHLDSEMARRVLELADRGVGVTDTSNETLALADRIHVACRTHRHSLRPNRARLVLLLDEVRKRHLPRHDELRDSIEGLAGEELRSFLAAYLPAALDVAGGMSSHDAVLRSCAAADPVVVERTYLHILETLDIHSHDTLFRVAVRSVIVNQKRAVVPPPPDESVHFIPKGIASGLGLSSGGARDGKGTTPEKGTVTEAVPQFESTGLSPARLAARKEVLTDRFLEMSKDDYERCLQEIDQNMDFESLKVWNPWVALMDKKRGSILQRAFGLFTSSTKKP